MRTNLEDISSVKKKIMVVIEADNVDKKLDEAYRDVQKKARIPGFRRGKVPRYILEKRFADQVIDDVSTALVKETFADAIKEIDIVPITEPVLNKETQLRQGEDFTYSVTLEVRPTFDLPEYMGIEIEKEKLVVDDQKVNDRIEKIREARGSLSSVEEGRPVQKGDFVVVNYEAFDGDVLLEDMTAKGAVIRIGDNRIHSEFDEALVGATRGDKREVSVVFDENDSRPVLAGKKIRFNVEVVDIKSLDLPDLDDDFVKQLDPSLKDVEDFKNRVREIITEEEKRRIERETKTKLLESIADKVDFELPQGVVNNELEAIVSNVKRELVGQGTDLERMGISEEKVREETT
ncbi:MAG: trigger factor [Desulfobacteraceae bacterium 4484_190.1]|nr:MAG: trigger factor [Desulfobacteraceae bacterium 4484_190.1]